MPIIDYNYNSHALMHPTTVKVVLPAEKRPQKTMYFLHGAISDAKNCLDNVDFQKYSDEYQTAFVLPSCGNMFYIDHGPAFGNYGKFVGKELVDVTRQSFGLPKDREDTAIAGFSMGGYGALRNGLKYYQNFGYIITFSAACVYEPSIGNLDDGEFGYFKKNLFDKVFGEKSKPGPFSENYRYLIEKAVQNKTFIPKIYMACGLDEEIFSQNEEFSAYLDSMGVMHEYVKNHGEHNWKLWSRQIEPALQWFMKDDL